MRKILTFVFAYLLVSPMANAAIINFTGDIEFHNDVIYTFFTLDTDATGVTLYTDSHQNFANFDPITALWDSSGSLIAENDDNSSINPATQTIFDSGFGPIDLVAGNYTFTVATFANFALGNMLSQGFDYDNDTPIALPDWNQPANGPDRGTYWSVVLSGVDSATNPQSNQVPEPSLLALLGVGFAAFRFSRTKVLT